MNGLLVSDFDFHLPPELIAQQPPSVRGQSRMLVMNRTTGTLRDDSFSNLPQLLQPGDLLVLNDSRVIPARLYAHRTIRREREAPTGKIEVMLTEPITQTNCHPERPQGVEGPASWNSAATAGKHKLPMPQIVGAPSMRPHLGAWVGDNETQPASSNRWHALVRPGRKVAIGEILAFPDANGNILLEAKVIDRGQFGERTIEFSPVDNFFQILDRIGHMPLPPYIHRDDATEDRDRYQTVFAEERGSVAAPTAGLHFTPELLAQLASKGIEIARVTLHVGLGTFAPLRVERLQDIHLHRERYSLSPQTAEALNRAVRDQRRIVAVGTTSVRTLETIATLAEPGHFQPHSGETQIFISPGYHFRLVNALLTNFHLPQSSLLMLVSAFASREQVLAAYNHAVQQNYRFFSYGDCMFLQ